MVSTPPALFMDVTEQLLKALKFSIPDVKVES